MPYHVSTTTTQPQVNSAIAYSQNAAQTPITTGRIRTTQQDEPGSMQKVATRSDNNPSPVIGGGTNTSGTAELSGSGDLTRQNLERFRISLKDYPKWDYDRQIRATTRTFHHRVTDGDNYKEALFDAARQRKPVVLMFGRSSDAATRQIVENSLKDARDRSGGQAVFVFIDMDEVDRDSPPGRYAAGVTEKHGFPMTLCFTMVPGDAYNPARSEVPTYHQTGPVTSERLHEAISRGKAAMALKEFPHVPLSESERPKERMQPRLTLSKETIQHLKPSGFQQDIPESAQIVIEARAKQNDDKRASYELFCRAIACADQSGDSSQKAAARAELGLACIAWGFPEKGFAWVLDAGKIYPDIYRNEKFADRLRHTGLPPATTQLLLQEGQRNATWYEPNKDQAIERLRAPMRFVDHRPVPLELTTRGQSNAVSRSTGTITKQYAKAAELATIQLTGSAEQAAPVRQQNTSRSTAEALPQMQLTKPSEPARSGRSATTTQTRFASPFETR